jgi:hypothetical protein
VGGLCCHGIWAVVWLGNAEAMVLVVDGLPMDSLGL